MVHIRRRAHKFCRRVELAVSHKQIGRCKGSQSWNRYRMQVIEERGERGKKRRGGEREEGKVMLDLQDESQDSGGRKKKKEMNQLPIPVVERGSTYPSAKWKKKGEEELQDEY